MADLRQRGFHAGLRIPNDIVSTLIEYAKRQPCSSAPGDSERFLIEQVANGHTPSGKLVAVADVEGWPCRTAWRLAGDAKLVAVARAYLGYRPTRVALRLYWSPQSDLSDAQRRWNGQTIDFHYDIEAGPTLYLYFYLSDTDRASGAHLVVAESHRAKPVWLRWASTRQREHVVLAAYGADNVVALEGSKGFGFFEDPACFHKVLPPVAANRLMLQLRYS